MITAAQTAAVALRAVRTPYGFGVLHAVRCASRSSSALCRSVGRVQRTCRSRGIPCINAPLRIVVHECTAVCRAAHLTVAGRRALGLRLASIS